MEFSRECIFKLSYILLSILEEKKRKKNIVNTILKVMINVLFKSSYINQYLTNIILLVSLQPKTMSITKDLLSLISLVLEDNRFHIDLQNPISKVSHLISSINAKYGKNNFCYHSQLIISIFSCYLTF